MRDDEETIEIILFFHVKYLIRRLGRTKEARELRSHNCNQFATAGFEMLQWQCSPLAHCLPHFHTSLKRSKFRGASPTLLLCRVTHLQILFPTLLFGKSAIVVTQFTSLFCL